MATQLRKLKIRRVALVDSGSNQEAFVTLFKRDSAQEVAPMAQETEVVGTETVAKADFEAAVAKATQLEAEVAKAAKDRADALADAETAKAELAKRDEAIEIAKFATDAKALPIFGDKGGIWLRAIARALGETDYAELHGKLSGVVKQVDASKLFSEIGSNGDGDASSPEGVAAGLAKVLRDADPTLTKEQALSKAYRTPEYKAARKGGK